MQGMKAFFTICQNYPSLFLSFLNELINIINYDKVDFILCQLFGYLGTLCEYYKAL